MLNHIKKFENKHKNLKKKVSDETYKILTLCYQMITEEKCNVSQDDLLKEKLDAEKMCQADRRMKMAVSYIRWCTIIENLIKEDTGKADIEYYIKSNSLQEMNLLGLGYYYDMKYRKNTETLYSVGYGKDSNWMCWLNEQNVKENEIKENGVQLIFKACKEQINRGGRVRLKSLSKCFGVDLFKYMQLDENGHANLYIIKDAPVNFIKIEGEEISLQEYLLSDKSFDINSNPKFCLDFSHPRNEKAENYNKWSKKFLGNDQYISQAEFDKKKDQYSVVANNKWDYILFEWLKQEHIYGADRAISSRVSPIADKEVIVSDTLWEIQDYNSGLMIESKKCYHFDFSREEYYRLIFNYFKKYAEKRLKQKEQINYNKNYEDRIKCELRYLEKELVELNKEKENLEEKLKMPDWLDEEQTQKEEIEKIKQLKEEKENLIDFFKEYIEFLKNINGLENIPKKIQTVLEFVNWEKEEIPKNWSINNIYVSKYKKKENLLLNLYKCICKRAAAED